MRNLFLALLCCALAACAARPARDADQLPSAHRQHSRITDQAIAADRAYIRSLHGRLAKLNAAGVPIEHYHLAKATAWVDFAEDEYSANDRSGVIEGALEQALTLIRALEAQHADLPMDTPHVTASHRIRPDLWEQAQALKHHARFACAQAIVAQLEVQLVWAGHKDFEAGWRHAKPYIGIAEDLAVRARQRIDACPPPSQSSAEAVEATRSGQAAAAVPPASATVNAVRARPVIDRVALSTDALFAFDKSGIADMLPGGRERLDALVERLKRLERLDRIIITGHTDRLGSAPYNLQLSEARAQSVRRYLSERGVPDHVMQAAGAGKSDPIIACSGATATPQLIECLQPNRRVEVELRGAHVR